MCINFFLVVQGDTDPLPNVPPPNVNPNARNHWLENRNSIKKNHCQISILNENLVSCFFFKTQRHILLKVGEFNVQFMVNFASESRYWFWFQEFDIRTKCASSPYIHMCIYKYSDKLIYMYRYNPPPRIWNHSQMESWEIWESWVIRIILMNNQTPNLPNRRFFPLREVCVNIKFCFVWCALDQWDGGNGRNWHERCHRMQSTQWKTPE